jgi:hypothetical protein
METTVKTHADIQTIFNSKIKWTALKVEEDMKKLQENYVYYLPWCGEGLWKNQFMLEHYQYYATNLPEDTDAANDYLTRTIKQLKEICMRSYNVRTDSTGALHRETSTWKFQCQLELIELLENIAR